MLSTTGGMGLSASPEAMVEDGVETRTGGAADLNVLSPHVVPPGEAPRSGPGGRFIETGKWMNTRITFCFTIYLNLSIPFCFYQPTLLYSLLINKFTERLITQHFLNFMFYLGTPFLLNRIFDDVYNGKINMRQRNVSIRKYTYSMRHPARTQ